MRQRRRLASSLRIRSRAAFRLARWLLVIAVPHIHVRDGVQRILKGRAGIAGRSTGLAAG